ncbi:MAG: MerR family transcriptional regulator [Acholeplasmataceae bacterium]|nr:MerR family transcriptional regulator [Acholeplasmataceae bacterium]
MEYSINELSKMSGLTTRTLRYYDEINLLKPKRVNEAGYRIYGSSEIDQLQQILFFRELEIELDVIKSILKKNNNEQMKLLKGHLARLLLKQKQITTLIANVNQTIESIEGGVQMKDSDKFKGFKKELLDKNDEGYKDEVIQKWGKHAYDSSRKQFENMTEEEYLEFIKLGDDILLELKEAYQHGSDETSSYSKKVAEMHKRWVQLAWGGYSIDAHHNLVSLYVEDERFKNHYDREQEGLAVLLRNAVFYHLK